MVEYAGAGSARATMTPEILFETRNGLALVVMIWGGLVAAWAFQCMVN